MCRASNALSCARRSDSPSRQGPRALGITVPRLRALLVGVDWRGAHQIPLPTLQAVRKRLESRPGFDVQEAAAQLGTTAEWVQARIDDGTVRVSRAKWDRRRRYLSAPMLERLRAALAAAQAASTRIPEGFVTLGAAAIEAGVSVTYSDWLLPEHGYRDVAWRALEQAELITQTLEAFGPEQLQDSMDMADIAAYDALADAGYVPPRDSEHECDFAAPLMASECDSLHEAALA